MGKIRIPETYTFLEFCAMNHAAPDIRGYTDAARNESPAISR
jgi:hypothetical protein